MNVLFVGGARDRRKWDIISWLSHGEDFARRRLERGRKKEDEHRDTVNDKFPAPLPLCVAASYFK